MLKQEFIESIIEIVGTESKSFIEALDRPVVTSVRYNPFKIDDAPQHRPVTWSRYGFVLDKRPIFTLDPLFHAGQYYVQESSSMFVEHIMRSVFEGETEGLKVLDLCAAPGGKTTIYSTLVGLDGLVVANEVIRSRATILAENARKWGLGNIIVTNNDPSHFSEIRHFFDVIAVDAPCSGEGMFRKSKEARSEWSLDNVQLCAQRQRRILKEVWRSLRPGGVLIYSTCTFNRQENEENLQWMIDNFDCEAVQIDNDPNWGIVESKVADFSGYRFYPHKVEGEGFYVTTIRKSHSKLKVKLPKPRRRIFSELTKQEIKTVGEYLCQPSFMKFAKINDTVYGFYSKRFRDVKVIADGLTAIFSGVEIGQLFGTKLKPEHSLALFHDVNREKCGVVELNLEDSLEYLRKGDLSFELMDEGLNLICYKGAPLGWAKRINRRVNNMYPKELRILMAKGEPTS